MPQDTLKVPELSLILLIGSTGVGKSTFARRLSKPTEIVSSDGCRGLVADDENDQSASQDAFELIHYLVAKRLKRGLLTVVDATNVQAEGRKPRNVKAKRNLALRKFALGVERLERFIAGQPLRRVHQCVFGVLALWSEAVDTRL